MLLGFKGSLMILGLFFVLGFIGPRRANHSWKSNKAQDKSDSNEFDWRGRLSSGEMIEVKGVRGNIRAEATTRNEVEVRAIKRGPKNEVGAVEISVIKHTEGVTICTLYPTRDPRRPNQCKPGEGGDLQAQDSNVRVDFTVRVPSGVRFVGRTAVGEIEARSLTSEVGAYTVNGDIQISTSSFARAKSVNGAITASIGSADWVKPISFETVNGDIDLTLPAKTDTDVKVETRRGKVTSELPIKVQGSFKPGQLVGSIGAGTRLLTVKTINGQVWLRSDKQ